MTAAPKRIRRRRTKGWRMPESTVYVGRPTIFGNPFTVETAMDAGYLKSRDERLAALFLHDCFADWLGDAGARGGRDWWSGPEGDRRRAAILARLPELRGKNLCCWCPIGEPCHADVLLELANA